MILFVEDDVDLADTCVLLLVAHGFVVEIAKNGVEALQKMAHGRPDLIISDCQMPLMDGIELCTRVRALDSEAPIPIILISGTERDRKDSGAQYDAFLRKPFRAEQLIVTIRALLNPLFRQPSGRSGTGGVSVH